VSPSPFDGVDELARRRFQRAVPSLSESRDIEAVTVSPPARPGCPPPKPYASKAGYPALVRIAAKRRFPGGEAPDGGLPEVSVDCPARGHHRDHTTAPLNDLGTGLRASSEAQGEDEREGLGRVTVIEPMAASRSRVSGERWERLAGHCSPDGRDPPDG
jgi:hypothetical protein